VARYWFAVCAGKIGSPVRRFIINRVPPAGGTAAPSVPIYESAACGCALAHSPQTTREVRATFYSRLSQYGPHAAPCTFGRGLARTVPGADPRRCTPGFHRSTPRVGAISPVIYPFPTLGLDPARDSIYDKGLARTVPGADPRRCTPGFHRSTPRVGAISPVIYPFPTLGLDPARDSIYDKGLARTVPGAVPRRCTPGFHRSPPRVGAISPVIYPFHSGARSLEGLDL
jgi:hypothetical protein